MKMIISYDAAFISLGIYALVTTILLIIMTIKLARKSERICENCSARRSRERLKRKTPDLYEDAYLLDCQNPPTQQPKKILTNPLPAEPKTENQNSQDIPPHHYEEIKSLTVGNNYNIIVEHVSSTLSGIYNNGLKGTEVYTKFLHELLAKIRNQNPELYESLSSFSNTQLYDEINESKAKNKDKIGSYKEDEMYAEFISKQKKPANAVEQNSSFGSSDHLKYLVEYKSLPRDSREGKDDYLPAKSYKALDNCPESIRRLCKDKESCDKLNKMSECFDNDQNATHTFNKETIKKLKCEINVQLSNQMAIRNSSLTPKLPPRPRKLSTNEDTL